MKYVVSIDSFNFPVRSHFDEYFAGHRVIDEKYKEEFINEQISIFREKLLSTIHPLNTRGNFVPFSQISKKYRHFLIPNRGGVIFCPHCRESVSCQEWNELKVNIYSSTCPNCGYKFELED